MAGKTEYKRIWNEERLDRIYLTVPKGRKDELKARAAAQDKSLNQYIVDALDAAEGKPIEDKPDMVMQYKGKDMEFKIIDTKK
jgi:hypothetical protein